MRKPADIINSRIENKWSVVILTAYLCIVFSMQAIALDAPFKLWVFLGIFVASVIVSLLVIAVAGKWLNRVKPETVNKSPWLWGLVSFVLVLGVYSVYHLGQYPGGLTSDSIQQYQQALGDMEYNNWHPILHTLLFYTLPIKLGRRLGFIITLQIGYFALAFGYLIYVLAKNGFNKLCLILFDLYIILNPYLATYIMFSWKDLAFMIFAIWMIACYVQIVCTKGHWLKKWYNVLSYSLALILGNSMRHNAILFVLPLVVITIVYVVKEKKTRLVLSVSVIVLLAVVKIFVSALHLPSSDRRVVETIGLPVTIWSDVMRVEPESLSDETRERLLSVASLEDYQEVYNEGDFNSLKFSGKCDLDKLDTFTYSEVFTYMFECFKVAPETSMRALAKLTMPFWDYTGFFKPTEVLISCFDFYGMRYEPKMPFYHWVNALKTLADNPVGSTLFGSYGFMMLSLFLVAAVLFASNRKSFLHILPIFFYNGGTSLLLSTYFDYRFFLYTITIWIPLLFIMLKDRNVLDEKK